jgi:hypothetical protein
MDKTITQVLWRLDPVLSYKRPASGIRGIRGR